MIKKGLFFTLLLYVLSGCSHAPDTISTETEKDIRDINTNLRVVVYNDEITDPKDDYRSFYKVFINKIEEGRTTIGLESQKKVFEIYLSPNRHLVHIEKWILDEKNNRYVKVNNVDQPKPDFAYVDVQEHKILELNFSINLSNSASISIDYHR